MDKPEAHDGLRPDSAADDLPPGDHPLEVAARRGIGPLSPHGAEVWHGRTRPCVSCGQLVPRDHFECDHCGQDLSEEMLAKMRAVAGPWYVLEHVRPFPGVNIERIIRQIRRGVLTETSIVRGPSTDFQWRFAADTPGLCRYFNRCWNCSEEIVPTETHCPACLSNLSFERPQASATAPPPSARDRFDLSAASLTNSPARQSAPHIRELSAALNLSDPPLRNEPVSSTPRIGPVSVVWVIAIMLIAAIMLLVWVTQIRNQADGDRVSAASGVVLVDGHT